MKSKKSDELNLITLAQKYSDNDTARELLEKLRWPEGPVCPHCANKDGKPIYKLTPKANSARPARQGLYKCGACRKQFTVTVGTIFEDSHIPIGKWLMAFFILCSSKKGMSSNQLSRMLGLSYKSAWFMTHRIRYAMNEGPLADLLKGAVEIDETFVGGEPRPGDKPQGGYRANSAKVPVVALIQRGGPVRTAVVANVSEKNLGKFIFGNVDKSATCHTDQHGAYKMLYPFAKHHTVNHSKGEYARLNSDGSVTHVNTCESFFSLIKRGVYGSFHHVSKEHLHRYCDEFSFRWNTRDLNDGERMEAAISMVVGKRLTYRQVV